MGVMFQKKINQLTGFQKMFIGMLFICAALIYAAEGLIINPFAIWNSSPLMISFISFRSAIKNHSKSELGGCMGFTLVSMALTLFFHGAWYFDWGETKTGSSTSGLIFIFIPIYALIVGGIGYVIGWFLGKGMEKKT